jgi:hypothetical protein
MGLSVINQRGRVTPAPNQMEVIIMFNNKTILALGNKRVSFTFKANGFWNVRKYRINSISTQSIENVDIDTANVGEIMDNLYQDGYSIVA